MDLTHVAFVHAATIGAQAVASAPFDVSHAGNTCHVERWIMDVEPPPLHVPHLPSPGRTDRWQIIRYDAPGTVVIDSGAALANTGAREGDRSQGFSLRVINIMTPETKTTHHLFWNTLRSYKLHDRSLTRSIHDGSWPILEEDITVLEAQQRAIDEEPRALFYNMNIDAGAMWSRRIIQNMIAAEAEPAVLVNA